MVRGKRDRRGINKHKYKRRNKHVGRFSDPMTTAQQQCVYNYENIFWDVKNTICQGDGRFYIFIYFPSNLNCRTLFPGNGKWFLTANLLLRMGERWPGPPGPRDQHVYESDQHPPAHLNHPRQEERRTMNGPDSCFRREERSDRIVTEEVSFQNERFFSYPELTKYFQKTCFEISFNWIPISSHRRF